MISNHFQYLVQFFFYFNLIHYNILNHMETCKIILYDEKSTTRTLKTIEKIKEYQDNIQNCDKEEMIKILLNEGLLETYYILKKEVLVRLLSRFEIIEPINNYNTKEPKQKRITHKQNRRVINVKRSSGIICIRRNNKLNRYEVLLVEKKHTYAYFDFIHGNYNKDKISSIVDIIFEMTMEEKLLILSKDFSLLWESLWNNNLVKSMNKDCQNNKRLEVPNSISNSSNNNYKFDTKYTKSSLYESKKEQYDEIMNKYNLERVILSYNHSGELRWEVPKGRVNDQESELFCAIRELEEETSLKIYENNVYNYQLIPNLKFSTTVLHNNNEYECVYFCCYIKNNSNTEFNLLNNKQLNEIKSIKWVSMNMLKEYNVDCEDAIRKSVNYIKSKKINRLNLE